MEKELEQKEGQISGIKKIMPRNKKFFLMGVGGVFLLVVLATLVFTIRGFYTLQDNSLIRFFAKTFNVPVASINDMNISYYDYLEDLRTLKLFYSSNPEGFAGVTDDMISDQVLGRLVANKLVEEIAKELNVEVTDEEVNKTLDELVSQFATREEAEENLKQRSGWDLDKYAERIVKPYVLEQKVAEAFAYSTDERWAGFEGEEVKARHILFLVNEDTTEKEKETIRKQALAVLKRLQAGEDFGTLAQEFGSDGTAEVGGDLGWFGKGLMVPEFEAPVFALEAGELSPELIESRFGFHIVRLDERRAVRDLNAYLDSQTKQENLKVLLPVHNPFEQLDSADGLDDQTEK